VKKGREMFMISKKSKSFNRKKVFGYALLLFVFLLSTSKLMAAGQYIPLGDGDSITYNGIPFVIFGEDLHVIKTSSEFIPVDTIDLSGYSANKIHLLEAAAFATNVPNGVTVGKIRVYYEDGSFDAIDLIMGFNTAEWAYDRPENQCCLAHNKITPAYSELTNSGSR
jgi:hypothetical protein